MKLTILFAFACVVFGLASAVPYKQSRKENAEGIRNYKEGEQVNYGRQILKKPYYSEEDDEVIKQAKMTNTIEAGEANGVRYIEVKRYEKPVYEMKKVVQEPKYETFEKLYKEEKVYAEGESNYVPVPIEYKKPVYEDANQVKNIKTTIAENVEQETSEGNGVRYNEVNRNKKSAYGMKKKIIEEPKYIKKALFETVEKVSDKDYETKEPNYESVKYKSPMKYEKPVEYPKYGEYKQEKMVEYLPSSNPLTYGQLGKRQSFMAENFTLNMNRVKVDNPAATGGTIRRLTTQNMPGLQDMSSSLKYLKPCSINLPHYHPRGSELIHVLEAENLLVGFAEENGGRVLINNLGSSDSSFIPQGLIHFEMNMGCKPAFYLSTYNNVDPGLVTVSNRVFDFPLEVLEATYYLTEDQIKLIRKYLPNTPTAGVLNYGFDECIERCERKENYETKPYKSDKYQESYKTESYETKKVRQYPEAVKHTYAEDAYEEESYKLETKPYKSNKYEDAYEPNLYETKKAKHYPEVEKPSYVEDAYDEETNEYEAKQYKSNKYDDSHKSYKSESYDNKKVKQYPDANDDYEKEYSKVDTKPYKSKKHQESSVGESYKTEKTKQYPILVKPIEPTYDEDSYEPEFYVSETTTKQSLVYTTKAPYIASTPYKLSY